MAYEVDRKWHCQGYTCVVVSTDMGHRCGYVGVPKSHPLYGKEYGDPMPEITQKDLDDEPIGKRGIVPIFLFACGSRDTVSLDLYFDIHGGLTYSKGNDYPIDQPETWWFGFDCAHSGDAPDDDIFRRLGGENSKHYQRVGAIRSEAYVVAECESLARQLAEAATLITERRRKYADRD